MAHPIRYAILDDAVDQPGLFHLTERSMIVTADGSSEVHPARSVDEVRPHLLDLLREGHVEIWLFEEPESPALTLDDAVAVVSDDANWNAETASTLYGVITTESGERELKAEREALRGS